MYEILFMMYGSLVLSSFWLMDRGEMYEVPMLLFLLSFEMAMMLDVFYIFGMTLVLKARVFICVR